MDDLAQYQLDLKNLLLGDPALAVVPVYKFKDQVIADVAAQDLGAWQVRVPGKSGVAIEVRLPAVRARYPEVGGPQLQLEFTIRIFEDAAQNTTGLTCEGIGLEVLQWLDGQVLEGGAAREGFMLYADDRHPALSPKREHPDRFCYEAVLVAGFPRAITPRSAQPALSDDDAGLVTLATTDGANIFYTLDGSCPVIPINPDGSPGVAAQPTNAYTAPFTVVAGTVVRWLAWLPGFYPSFVGKATVNIP
jgi:hypothetical protein